MSPTGSFDRSRNTEQAGLWKHWLAYLLACVAVVGVYVTGSLEFIERGSTR